MSSFNMDKGISLLVGTFCDPLIVFPGGWEDTIPDWLKTSVTLERLMENMKYSKGEEPTGTDAEACIYLYTASLCQPPDHDWTQIYLYLATKTYEHWRTKDSGVRMPDDIRVDELTRNQEDDLKALKRWIFEKRTGARVEKMRAERRQKKEEEAARKKEAQPALFDF